MSKPIQVQKHQPERRRQPVTTVYCGGTCCCCCCCLHSVGSLVGAAIAPTIGGGGGQPNGAEAHWTTTSMIPGYYEDDPDDAFPRPTSAGLPVPDIRVSLGPSSVTVFWWLLCALIVFSFVASGVTGGSAGITGVLVLLGLPLIQLASVFLTMVVFIAWPRPDRAHQLAQVGKIAGGVVLGSIIGTLPMLLLALMLGAFR